MSFFSGPIFPTLNGLALLAAQRFTPSFRRPGMRFSEVVATAKAQGYTEPDPRDDLSGAWGAGDPRMASKWGRD